ncbi:MAG: aspartate--tRNA ligase, partial [Clostridiales bacterium]|nr:aspartate--tRNA ligase [Clostridiales bacterium]
LRADRQPEFTQIDVELSFATQEQVLQKMVGLVKHVFRTALSVELPQDTPRLTWQQAMDLYGSDKPDLRFDMPIVDMTDLMAGCPFSVFRRAVDAGGAVRGLTIPGGASLPRTAIEALTEKAAGYGAAGMAWIAVRDGGEPYSILTKYFSDGEMAAIIERAGARPGDFILFCADQLPTVRRVLGGLRLDVADMLDLRREGEYRLLLVTDFPQFEYSQEEGRFVAAHHPFTMPHPEDLPYLQSDPARVRSQAYDIVLNGVELGSGSIRIHSRDVQRRMFDALGLPADEIERRFGFMLRALSYGTPPHGGFALGLDRLVMLMLDADSMREVIAFPKIKDASCPMTAAPDGVDEKQLADLNIRAGAEKAARKAARQQASGGIDVAHVARLAQLHLTPDEEAAMARDLGAIVAFADQLQKIDTRDVPPTAHVAPSSNVFRADRPAPSMDRDALLALAPAVREGCVYVPRTVE